MPLRPFRPLTILARSVLLIAISACAGSDDDAPARPAATIDTLPGGVVHVRNAAAPANAADSIPTLSVATRVGEAMGEDVYLFGRIYDVATDGAGRVYVADAQAKEVRVFDPAGRHVRTMGRQGQGPGELENPIALVWGPDGNLWVVDPRNQRYTVFDTAGAVVGTHRRQVGGWGIPWTGGFDAEGRLLDLSLSRDARWIIRHERSDDALVPTDSFAPPPPPDGFEPGYYRVDNDAGGYMMFEVPFAVQHRWRLDARGRGLWSGTTDRYRFVHTTPEGDTLRVVEMEHAPEPVTDADMESARARIDRALESAGNLEAGRRQIDYGRVPKQKPAWSELFVSEEGDLWVARPADPDRTGMGPTVFDVFDAEGVWQGAVRAPVGLWPVVKVGRERVVGVRHDEMEVAEVVVAELSSAADRP